MFSDVADGPSGEIVRDGYLKQAILRDTLDKEQDNVIHCSGWVIHWFIFKEHAALILK